jgi:hypothetical protein
MKILVLTFIMITAVTFVKAQLANSKWSGKLAVPLVSDVTLDFRADTVNVILMDTGDIIESCVYSVKNNMITMTKLGGGSPCDIGSVFSLNYIIKDNKLFLKVLTDPCTVRAGAWLEEPFKKE